MSISSPSKTNYIITRDPAMKTGVPCNENRFFPVRVYYTGKTLFCPCTDPVRDCSVVESLAQSGPTNAIFA